MRILAQAMHTKFNGSWISLKITRKTPPQCMSPQDGTRNALTKCNENSNLIISRTCMTSDFIVKQACSSQIECSNNNELRNMCSARKPVDIHVETNARGCVVSPISKVIIYQIFLSLSKCTQFLSEMKILIQTPTLRWSNESDSSAFSVQL